MTKTASLYWGSKNYPNRFTSTNNIVLNDGSWNGDQAGHDSKNVRCLIDSSNILISASSITVEFYAASSIEGFSIDSAYVGHQAASGDPYDFDGGQVQLLFGGSGSKLISVGSTATSDTATISIDNTKNLIISVGVAADLSNDSYRTQTSATGFTRYAKDSGLADAGTTAPTGIYETATDFRCFVGEIIKVS